MKILREKKGIKICNKLLADDKEATKKLESLLSHDLDFHAETVGYASHNFHAFPAKFPPQLPRKFILELTDPGDVVLDPLMGSGTTILEAYLAGRQSIGFDIDPLSVLISRVKVTPIDMTDVEHTAQKIVDNAREAIRDKLDKLTEALDRRWDVSTREFINYWFSYDTQKELLALRCEIEKIDDVFLKNFFDIVFSAIIITKSGGISLALDLAHTRPHRAKTVISEDGNIIFEGNSSKISSDRMKLLRKIQRSAIDEFEKRCRQNFKGIMHKIPDRLQPQVSLGNAQSIPMGSNSVDLIVTSPPYASNAIDYMRAHKFSLVWMGYSLKQINIKRKECIGGDSTNGFAMEKLYGYPAHIVSRLKVLDRKKAAAIQRFFSEMTSILREMFRVLKPGRSAIVVVGSSVIRGVDIETQKCLAEIGKDSGFIVPQIGVRRINRNRRMLPVGATHDKNCQIQQRMQEEYVIGFYKPDIQTLGGGRDHSRT